MLQLQQSALPHVESTSLEPAQQATVHFRNMAMWILRVDALIKPVECQRRGDIVAVLPRLELAAVDVVVAHASAKLYAAEAAKTSGWTAARAERTKRTRFRKDVPDHAAFRFVPFAVETCGYMGKEAVKFVNRLGDIAAESGRIPKGAFVRWTMQLLSVTVQRGNAEMYRRSGLVISREQGLR